jgi:hypothetical protein
MNAKENIAFAFFEGKNWSQNIEVANSLWLHTKASQIHFLFKSILALKDDRINFLLKFFKVVV